jgi:lipopolysaccharide export system protein LptA
MIIVGSLISKDWDYSADILEKKIENGEEIRLFKSRELTNNQVIISNDTILIFTKQAKQYINKNELELIGPVTMINGKDSLKCSTMRFWYDIDSLHAYGDVRFSFKNNILSTDTLIYSMTNGFRGYSFKTFNNSKLNDGRYKIESNQINYNDYNQQMKLIGPAFINSEFQGAEGNNIFLQFKDSLIKNLSIKENGYVFNKHLAFINSQKQLFKDEMKGNIIEVEFNDKNIKNIKIEGMARSDYYIINDSTILLGFNKSSGDTIAINYNNKKLNNIILKGDARGIFYPEKGISKIDSTLSYRADFINYNIKNEITLLMDNVNINYQNTELISNNVEVNWNNNTLYAFSEEEEKSQISSDNQKPIIGENLEFDLINKKGIVKLGETKVGDGFYKSQTIYREEPNIYHMDKSIYTTCDHDIPHYYFKTPKMKMLQGERIIAKPLLLYISDIPIFGIPFAILPNKNESRQSGWIMPSFGVSKSMGTYFQKLGYYWAPNDYSDTKLLIDFYDEDRIELRTNTRYIKRYKFTGNISTTIKRKLNNQLTNDMADLFTEKSIQNFDIKWKHNHQISQTQNLNINWNYVSSSNFYNDIGYDLNTRTQQKLESSAGYSKVWAEHNNRLSIALSESYDLVQDSFYPTLDDNIEEPILQYYKNRVLPNILFSHSNSKIFGNGDRWYNSIYYSFSSKLNGIQKIGHLFNYNSDNQSWVNQDSVYYNNSVTHNIKISAPNKWFGWLTINPSINLNEGWITKYIVNENEINNFKRRLTGNFSLSSSTTIYGLFQINKMNINSIRHIISPSISMSYSPDFSKPFFNVDLGYFDSNGDDYFANSMIGSTPSIETQRISFNLKNNFQMKLNDSTNTKIDFLNWNISSGYNVKAPTLKFDVIKSRIYLRILDDFDFDFTMYHDLYKLDNDLNRLNEYSKVPNLTFLQAATDISLFGASKIINSNTQSQEQVVDTLNRDEKNEKYNSNDFFNPTITKNKKWEMDRRLGAKLQKKSINGQLDWEKTAWIQPIIKLQLSQKWKITYSGQIDLINNSIISHNMYLYRSLHCWEFGLKWWPSGNNSGFLLNIRVKSPNLRDVKLKSSGGSLFGL